MQTLNRIRESAILYSDTEAELHFKSTGHNEWTGTPLLTLNSSWPLKSRCEAHVDVSLLNRRKDASENRASCSVDAGK